MVDGGKPTTLFLRNDDVGERTAALISFLTLFKSKQLPVSHQVIPRQLSDECADWLSREFAETPDLLEFGQHGLSHEMMIGGRREFYEFGPERDRVVQEAIIAEGRAILAAKLGKAFSGRVFTPPRHRFDRATLLALESQGFDVFSAAAYADPARRAIYAAGRALGMTNFLRRGIAHHGRVRPEARLFELSISVAVDHGAPIDRKVSDVMAEIHRAQRHSRWVGLMFHHEAWASPAGMAFLDELTDVLAGLPAVRFALPGQIVRTGNEFPGTN